MVETTSGWNYCGTEVTVESDNEKRAGRIWSLIAPRVGKTIQERDFSASDGENGEGLERSINRVYEGDDADVKVTISFKRRVDGDIDALEYAERELDAFYNKCVDIIETVFEEYDDDRTIRMPRGEWADEPGEVA